jgi:L-alanine-DL-glutamate epimerase-like enolase superfamily enzyme
MASFSTTDRPTVCEAPPIESVEVAVFQIPTDEPESDGTLKWDSTTMVTSQIDAGGQCGFGFTYAPRAAAVLIRDLLSEAICGQSSFDIEGCWQAMVHRTRNAGQAGMMSYAIAAVDHALWDLKAKLLGLPLAKLWGQVRESTLVYGSGGFTSYDDRRLGEQLGNWAESGFQCVKMKVGRNPADDARRVALARRTIGDEVALFVDANGGYSRKQALQMAEIFSQESNVSWFEEPRPSDDLEGLRLLRDRGPGGMAIAAGEYGNTPDYFRRMLAAGAVDCLQADTTRCGGFTGFFKVAALCEAFHIPLSAHCAPQLHAHLACCLQPIIHLEYFHDHVRIADLLFDEPLRPEQGRIRPDATRAGLGIVLKSADARKYELAI